MSAAGEGVSNTADALTRERATDCATGDVAIAGRQVEIFHLVGDDDNVAFCGLDVTDHRWSDGENEQPCVVCHDLGDAL